MGLYSPFCDSHKDWAGEEPGFTSDNLGRGGGGEAFFELSIFRFDLACLHIFYGFPFVNNGFLLNSTV